jgi:hypothetical protein
MECRERTLISGMSFGEVGSKHAAGIGLQAQFLPCIMPSLRMTLTLSVKSNYCQACLMRQDIP